MKTKITIFILILLFGLTCTACSIEKPPAESAPLPAAPASPGPGETAAEEELPADTRPAEIRVISPAPAGFTAPCLAEVYEALCVYEDGEILPLLAEGAPVHESGSGEYVFTLPDFLTDSEGRPFGAAEAAAAMEHYGEQDDGLFLRAEVTEEEKLLLRFSRELSADEARHWFCTLPLFAEKEGSPNGFVGTGPYAIGELSGEGMLLLPNGHFRADEAKRQNVRSIRYLFIDDRVDTVIALETLKADMALALPYEEAEDFLPGGSYADLFKVVDNYGAALHFLLPNVAAGKALSAQNSRLDVFGCLDVLALSSELGGSLHPILTSPEEADSDGVLPYGAYRLTLLCSDRGEDPLIAGAVRRQLENKGVILQLLTLPEEEYRAALASGQDWDLALVETEGGAHPAAHWAQLWELSDTANVLRGGLSDSAFLRQLRTLSLAAAPEEADVLALREYISSHAYALALPRMNTPSIVPLTLLEAVRDGNGVLLPGACQYEDEYDG